MKQSQKFSKVSEFLAAGGMGCGLYLLEKVERTSEKAIGFKAEKFNSCGYLKPATCWFPKSKLQVVANDFYTTGPAEMFLVPAWLYSAKSDEGYMI